MRDWRAVSAWFRRGGAMKHRNAPRGGAGSDSDIEEGLEEYQSDRQRKAEDALFQANQDELGRAAVNQCRKDHQKREEEPPDSNYRRP